MPSIHAILLVALGGWGAGPDDYQTSDPPAAYDPFTPPVEFRAPAPRQPLAAANGTAPVAVTPAPSPLPNDYGAPPSGYAAPEQFQPQDQFAGADPNVVSAIATQPGVGDPSGAYIPATEPLPGADNTLPYDSAPPESNVPATAYAQPPGRLPAQSIPLRPPGAGAEGTPHAMPTVAWPVVGGSLAGVIGLFLIVVWILRRGAPRAGGLLPREVVEVLGRAPLADHKQMQLLRLGNKLVLVAISPTSTDTLAEITEPTEVDRLTGLCYQRHPHSSTVAFEKVFKSFETPSRRPAARGKQRVDFADLERLAYDDSRAESDNVH